MRLAVLVVESAGENTGGSPKGHLPASCCDLLVVEYLVVELCYFFLQRVRRPQSVPSPRCRPA